MGSHLHSLLFFKINTSINCVICSRIFFKLYFMLTVHVFVEFRGLLINSLRKNFLRVVYIFVLYFLVDVHFLELLSGASFGVLFKRSVD